MTPALWCIPIAFFLIYLPKVPLTMAMAKQPEGYDNKDPRDQQSRLPPAGKRAQAAHANGFEAFAPFAAAVFLATAGGGPPAIVNGLALTHVVARFLYPWLYIYGIDRLRSLVWFVGFLATAILFFTPIMK